MDVKRIYVAGKLNSDTVGYNYNCHKMMNEAELLREAGYNPFVPCLVDHMGRTFGWEDYKTYFEFVTAWLVVSDALYLVSGWETSAGTKREIEMAWENHIPVFDNLPELYEYANGVIGGEIVGFTYDEAGNVKGSLKRRNTKEYVAGDGRA